MKAKLFINFYDEYKVGDLVRWNHNIPYGAHSTKGRKKLGFVLKLDREYDALNNTYIDHYLVHWYFIDFEEWCGEEHLIPV